MNEMIARCDLRHDPTVFFVRGDLRGDFAREQLRGGIAVAAAQNRDRSFITGGFKGQYCHVERSRDISRSNNLCESKNSKRFLDSALNDKSGTARLFLYRFRLWGVPLRVNHDAFERVDRPQHLQI